MQVISNLLKDWYRDGSRFSFPIPKDPRGFYPHGFVRKNDSTADFFDWYGLDLVLKGEDGPKELTVTAFFPEHASVNFHTTILIENGVCRTEIPFSQFEVEQAQENIWEFLSAIEISCPPDDILSLIARRRKGLYVSFPIQGLSADCGSRVTYSGTVTNCSDKALFLSASQQWDGWECMAADIVMEPGILNSGESRSVTVHLTIPDTMVPGGHETTSILWRGQGGDATYEEAVSLKTLCALPHPYLYHNAEGWAVVVEKIHKYPQYAPAFQKYLADADAWEVTPPIPDAPYCYLTQTESGIMSAAYAYALTKDICYAEKIAKFFRYFSAEYPKRLRGCHQSFVQEGHFFQHLAVPYDIIHDSGVLTEEDHLSIRHCFRLYMNTLDRHVRSGHISNWILSELVGGFYCALTLQDIHMALRFVFGPCGIISQFRHGIFNDGWWHECSVGYNTWVSSMMIHTAHALKPFGYDLIHAQFAMPFNKEIRSSYQLQSPKPLSAMFNQKWGGNLKNTVCIQDMFDATLPFLDYRGVLFGIADSDEKKLSGVHFGSTYDLAYTYYRNPEYIPIIRRNPPEPVFGDPLLPEYTAHADSQNAFSDNIGIAMLRSQTEGRSQRDQIQAVLRYGSHGGAHGHFDTASLLSVMRYGRSFYNPENCWWGYAHFMYKFYVQNSLTKNMVVVDEKMQEPTDSRRTLFYCGKKLQAAAVEVKARWSYPPYGGMVYYQDGQAPTREDLRKRCAMSMSDLPIVEGDTPVYGECTEFTEPVHQKRVMAVTDDYIALFDYLKGEQPHQFDNLMQIKGFCGLEGAERIGHSEQMNSNPISDAQFITDCLWYQAKDGSVARFVTEFTEEHAGERHVCDRSNYNEPGPLHMDVHTAWPKESTQMVGRVAVYDGWAADHNGYTIPLSYQVLTDKKQCASGAFRGWILGREDVDVDISGAKTLFLRVTQEDGIRESGAHVATPQGIFWGDAALIQKDGRQIRLASLMKPISERFMLCNIDPGYGPGKDYQNGRVTIIGKTYSDAIPFSPIDHSKPGYIMIDLEGLDAVRFRGCIGVDAFSGDEWQGRKTYSVRTCGDIGRFITVIEPHEGTAMVASVVSTRPDKVTVSLQDGRKQILEVTDIASEHCTISLTEISPDGIVITEKST